MIADPVDLPAAPRPGYCFDHPTYELVTHRRAGLRAYAGRLPRAIVCPSLEHPPTERERCRYCGGPLVAAGVFSWDTSPKRVYCSDRCRNRAFRHPAPGGRR